jgi:hypothetical protein
MRRDEAKANNGMRKDAKRPYQLIEFLSSHKALKAASGDEGSSTLFSSDMVERYDCEGEERGGQSKERGEKKKNKKGHKNF